MTVTEQERRHIVIVGGGIIGCTSAYFLSRHPAFDPSKHRITLLEASKIAGGASGKAGGLLALWAYPSSIVPLSFKLHKSLSDEHGGEERWGYRAVHCGQISCQGRYLPKGCSSSSSSGKMSVSGKDNEMDGIDDSNVDENVSLQKRSTDAMKKLHAAGVPSDMDWVSAECVRAYDDMGGPDATAQVHPFQFTNAMAELAREKGVEVRVRAKVTGLKYSENGDTIEGVMFEDGTNGGGGEEEVLSATDVVVAAGPWTSSMYPDVDIGALRAHSVTIRPSRPVSAYALFTDIKLPSEFKGATGIKHGGQNVRPEIYARPKNEVYACGEGDYMVSLPPSSDEVEVDESRCQDIVDFVSSVSDELRDGEVTARQACYLPSVSGSDSPIIGLTKTKGLIIAAGHTCWGIQNGPGTGKLVSELVFDKKAMSANIKSLAPRSW